MAFVELQERGHLKHLISQNVDGLHRKSGIAPENLSELHGNTNLEVCTDCGREYMRDYRVRNAQKVHDHLTGRKCDNSACKGNLKDTIINFNENLNSNILDLAMQNCEVADLCLCMGSSLRVSPASDMPVATAQNGGNVVIINLQKTPIDHLASLCIYGKCDDVMQKVFEKLNYQTPTWMLKKRVRLIPSQDKKSFSVCGIDSNGAHYEIFKQVEVSAPGMPSVTFPSDKQKVQPFTKKLPDKQPDQVDLKFTWQGHYGEPSLTIKVDLPALMSQQN